MKKSKKSRPNAVGRKSRNRPPKRTRTDAGMESLCVLAGGIAHDFNNILGVIMGFTQLAMTGISRGVPVKAHLEEAMEACHRAKDLVSQLIAFSRQIEDNDPCDIFSDQTVPAGTERILFVDDEAALGRMWCMLLEPLGYHVTFKTGSLDALETFQAHPDNFDIVITDLTMPEMTGIELATRLLKIKPDLPIILCSGFSGSISDRNISAMGIRELLMKPLVLGALSQAIRRAVGNPDESW